MQRTSREVSATAAVGPERLPGEGTGAQTWRSASQREIIVLAVYFFGIVAVTDVLNVRLGVEVLTLMVMVAAFTISRAGPQFVRRVAR